MYFLINLFLTALGLYCCAQASLVSLIGGCSLKVRRLLIAVASLVAEHTALDTWAQLRHTGLVAPRHVKSSRIRNQTCVPCVVWHILCHWTTREVHDFR